MTHEMLPASNEVGHYPKDDATYEYTDQPVEKHRTCAAVMTLIQSAKLNGHDPYAYLKGVLTRLPTQKNNAIGELLPHNWTPAVISKV